MNRTILLMVLLGLMGVGIVWFAVDYLSWGQAARLNPGEEKHFDTFQPDEKLKEVTAEVPWHLEEVARSLKVPWSLVFTGSERLLVSERTGQVRQIQDGVLVEKPLVQLAVSTTGEEGLMGMVLDPGYVTNRELYICYAYDNGDDLANRVIKLRDEGNILIEQATIIDQIQAARNHAGCRLGFGPDDKLYITTGDASDRELAQNLDSLAGKILRLDPDGTVPSDNPIPQSPIFSYGHRNPQGIDWHPETGILYSSEHGPSVFDGPAGGDEVNLIKAGANYGWPKVSHDEVLDGAESPLIQFTPAEAPGSLLIYSGRAFPQYENQIFFGALRGEGIVRLKLSEDGRQIVEEEKLDIDVGRIRDVVESPEGYIYLTTSNTDGRGTVRDGDDKVYRLVPVN